ncbi:MAG: hypothetical protein K0S06_586 [Microvirga sp.]|jgi:hypothetical protein|nr:hypothetical protein [Microvirga sp.]
MTNRNMVKDCLAAEGRRVPEPNRTSRPVLAPESESQVWTTREPVDSPQPKPQVRQERTKGLRKP